MDVGARHPMRANVVTSDEELYAVDHLRRQLVTPDVLEHRPRVKGMIAGTTSAVLELA